MNKLNHSFICLSMVAASMQMVHANTESHQTSLGEDAKATGNQTTAIGFEAKATGYRSTAVGAFAQATNTGSTALGTLSEASGEDSIAIGRGAKAKESHSFAAGLDAEAVTGGVALGNEAKAGNVSVAIGSHTDASADQTIAFGYRTKATTKNSIAIGHQAESSHSGSVAIGVDSKADGATLNNTAYLADSPNHTIQGHTAVGEVNIGQYSANLPDQYRRITGLAAGAEDTDAVNVSQLKAATSTLQNAVIYDGANKDKVTLAGSNGTLITNLKPGEVSENSTDAVNGSQLHTVKVDVGHLQNDVIHLQTDVNNLTIGFNDLSGRVDQLENKFSNFDKDTKAAISSALAVASLPQPTEKGATMLSVGSGFWDGETGFSVGASGVTEDKTLFNKSVNYVWKFASTSNTRSDWGASTAVGVQWK